MCTQYIPTLHTFQAEMYTCPKKNNIFLTVEQNTNTHHKFSHFTQSTFITCTLVLLKAHSQHVPLFYSKHIHNLYPCFTPSKLAASQTVSNFRPGINCAPFMLWSVCILISSPVSLQRNCLSFTEVQPCLY